MDRGYLCLQRDCNLGVGYIHPVSAHGIRYLCTQHCLATGESSLSWYNSDCELQVMHWASVILVRLQLPKFSFGKLDQTRVVRCLNVFQGSLLFSLYQFIASINVQH